MKSIHFPATVVLSAAMLTAAMLTAALLTAPACGQEKPNLRLFNWEQGIAARSTDDPSLAVYLWVYEWNMFEAMAAGQHTRGRWDLPRKVDPTGCTGLIETPELKLEMTAGRDSVDLLLTIVNRTDRDWPEIAGIIPCFNPGPPRSTARTTALVNTDTYFHGPDGLEKLKGREIHFNAALRKLVDARAADGKFVFSQKWPTAEPNATAGLLIRQTNDRRWVTGIAWEDFLSAQGHNPWDCMHLSVRVGPLEAGESKRIRGKMYLMPGTKEDCLQRYRADFEPNQ